MAANLLRRIPGWGSRRGVSRLSPEDMVKPGDRFYAIGRFNATWVVKRVVMPDGMHIPHVKLCREGTLDNIKEISIDALLTETLYARERRQSQAMIRAKLARRRTDDPRMFVH